MSEMSKTNNVTLVHLDLGIGGAEQLIVSIGCTLKEMGYTVNILTSHHDCNHCFEETKERGALGNCIEVHGDWLPRHIFGKCTAFCAIVRMLYLSLVLVSRHLTRRIKRHVNRLFGHAVNFDIDEIVLMDGVSASLPLFYLAGIPSIFYCHFPDKLLCTERSGSLKRLYRSVIDGLEEITTGCSSVVVVNSEFTAGVFRDSFPSLKQYRYLRPIVMYPTVKDRSTEIGSKEVINSNTRGNAITYTDGYDVVFVSINRYERKKNIHLAIDALQYLSCSSSSGTSKSIALIIAGGYDLSVVENEEYLTELKHHCTTLKLPYTHPKQTPGTASNIDSNLELESCRKMVVFRTSISGQEREALLARADALLYTPDKEHFGIVPLEAMYAGTPVICVASGGPLETVLDGLTGYLCKQDPVEFAKAMERIVADDITAEERNKLLKVREGYKKVTPLTNKSASFSSSTPLRSYPLSFLMGSIGHAHVQANFTSLSVPDKLEECVTTAIKNQSRPLSPAMTALRTIIPVLLLNIIILIAIGIGFSTPSSLSSSF